MSKYADTVKRESYTLVKNKNGITLVALVVTIIILLILAAISIASLTGNGLFEKAKLAKEKQENAEIQESEKLGDYENYIGNYVESSREQIMVDKNTYEQLLEDVKNLKEMCNNATTSNQTTILYPNGTENQPATIYANQRIVIDNPYEGHIVDCVAQIKYNGFWGETGWIYYGGGYGVTAGQLTGENYDKIIIQSGSNFVSTISKNIGNPHGTDSIDISSAPYRIIVTRKN